MISNMKSDQAKKFNIEIINSNKNHFSTLPNFDRPDCQEKGKNKYSKTQQQKFHLWASFYNLQKKHTTPTLTSILSFFSLKIFWRWKKIILQPKTKK